jgi:hypothetical protein
MSTNNINNSFLESIPNGETVKFRKNLIVHVLLDGLVPPTRVEPSTGAEQQTWIPMNVLITRPSDLQSVASANGLAYETYEL